MQLTITMVISFIHFAGGSDGKNKETKGKEGQCNASPKSNEVYRLPQFRYCF